MKSSRAGIDAAIAEPVSWRARSRRAPRTQARFAGGVLLVVALTAGAFGVDGLIQASREHARVASLQGELTSLQRQVRADEQDAASQGVEMRSVAGRATGVERSISRSLGRISWTLQSVPSEAELAHLRVQLGAYASCVGELQREIAGLGISWRINPGRPSADYFKLYTAARGASACAAVSRGG